MSAREDGLPRAANAGTDAQAPADVSGKPETERGFRPDIQGMRALAVSMVVVYHLYPALLPGGFAGVDVFFVISGFLITGHLLREYRRAGRIALVAFWGRRARRLLPAAVLVLTVTWVASRFLLPSTMLADTAAQVRASALYFENWQLAGNAVNYLKADSAATPVQHFWSLSVEEQFYLGWPLLFVLAAVAARTARGRARPSGPETRLARRAERARQARGQQVLVLLAAAVVAGSFGYSVYYTRVDPAGAYFATTSRIWELGLGGLLALLPPGVTSRLGRFGLLGWAGLGLVTASAFVLSGTTAFPGAAALLPAGGTAALILGGSAAGRFGPHRLTSARPAVFLGGISYSLYLWHWPVITLWTNWSGRSPDVISGLVIVVVSIALAWLTKVWVEDKVRTAPLLSGHGWRSVSVALAAVVPVALVSLYILSQPGPWHGHLGPDYPGATALARMTVVKPEPVLPPLTSIALPDYWAQGCLVAVSSATPRECVYGDTSHPVLTVALVGDSMAGNWFTPLQQIARQRHWELITDLHSVCPLSPALMITPDTGGPYTTCRAWGATVMHDLETTIRPDVVITSSFPGLATVAHPAGGPAAQAEIGTGMARYWDQLEAHAISVVAIKESPDVGLNIPNCLARHLNSVKTCTVPAARAIQPDRDLPTVYAHAAAGKVPLVDMNSLICGPVDCPPIIGNVLVYQDNHHLTSVYAGTTAPYLEERLLKADKTLARA